MVSEFEDGAIAEKTPPEGNPNLKLAEATEHYRRTLIHDLSNQMMSAGAIARFELDDILKNGGDIEKIKSTLSGIVESSEYGCSILRLFSDAYSFNFRPQKMQINTVLERYVPFFERLLNIRDCYFIFEGKSKLYIPMDPCYVSRAVTNLVFNARDIIPNKASVKLATRDVDKSLEGSQPYVELNVSDTGPGIDPAIIDRLFDGVTTKGLGHGSGLRIVKEVMNLHKGYVTVKSRPGEGASFYLYFPGK